MAVTPTDNPKTTPVGRQVRLAGRWWKLMASRVWGLQCRRCAKYKSPSCFDTDVTRSFHQHCRSCALRERPREQVGARAVDGQKTCPGCQVLQPTEVFQIDPKAKRLYRLCVTCRTAEQPPGDTTQGGFMALAERQLFPDLKSYDVPRSEIRAHPEQYPGRTYWDLTREERERIIERTKELVFAHTGRDMRTKPEGLPSRFDLVARDRAEGLDTEQEDAA